MPVGSHAFLLLVAQFLLAVLAVFRYFYGNSRFKGITVHVNVRLRDQLDVVSAV
jgi:hypothetical protein